MKTPPLVIELREFFARTGTSLSALAERSGVNVVYISRLKSGKQTDIRSLYADALREGMNSLERAPAHA